MDNVTEIFSLRLKALRGDKSQDEVSKGIGISRGALSYYESGDRKPDINTLYALAKYYGVSTDYLLGLSDTPSLSPEIKGICDKFGISDKALEHLEFLARGSEKLFDENCEPDQGIIWSYLYLQAVNILLYEHSDVMDDIAAYFFTNFTHYSDFYDDTHYHPIGSLELFDYRLQAAYGDDYDFLSDAILVRIQHGLKQIRNKYMSKLVSELPIPEDGVESYKVNFEHIKKCFQKLYLNPDIPPFE